MKLFLKILFLIFTTITIMVGETKSSTLASVLQEETSYLFFEKSQLARPAEFAIRQQWV